MLNLSTRVHSTVQLFPAVQILFQFRKQYVDGKIQSGLASFLTLIRSGIGANIGMDDSDEGLCTFFYHRNQYYLI